ncbi:hypothetical protein BSLA_02r1799 [Burkholderia stabilis]|nr:hypothetical protein BSLA_02r1799 [Burkholderia stabilis]
MRPARAPACVHRCNIARGLASRRRVGESAYRRIDVSTYRRIGVSTYRQGGSLMRIHAHAG